VPGLMISDGTSYNLCCTLAHVSSWRGANETHGRFNQYVLIQLDNYIHNEGQGMLVTVQSFLFHFPVLNLQLRSKKV
jgi:hypothetical protein